jgi:hydrogenase maturation protein HypF
MSSRGIQETQRSASAVEIRVRGCVQGVGFRPAVWRLARELGLCGDVRNDAEGVLIRVAGTDDDITGLIGRLRSDAPPLARIEAIESRPIDAPTLGPFQIADTSSGPARTDITPDAVVCAECAREVLNPSERRYRYPFANCTECGPRFSIITQMPFERRSTTMSPFGLCEACRSEYDDPSDRRFHAEAIACPRCGPKVRLVRFAASADGPFRDSGVDDLDAARTLLKQGHVLAVKGLGGYQLACDASNAAAVQRLREGKRREAKPFALMARDLELIRRYCTPGREEERQLASAEGPIVLLRATGPERLPEAVAPGLRTLGFMLPTTPLHLLLLQGMPTPLVMTSGNVSDEPQVIEDDEAARRLGQIAAYALVHDRLVANRIDDSVVRVMGGTSRVLRRARGFAPAPIRLPPGFESAPDLLALGGELKATFCLLRQGQAVLSPHQGDLEEAESFADFERNLARHADLFDHVPQALVADCHPEYISAKLAREHARAESLPLIEVQHHHAHVAACLAENGRPLDAPPVLGIVLDGLGWGSDGTFWGGEFLLADYARAERRGTFKPVALAGGTRAMREPWRNLYAHLIAEMSWAELTMNFHELELHRYLAAKPRETIEAMIRNSINSPLASSCGRLFDAVAAAVGICREVQLYEGEAACRLESIVDERTLRDETDALAYPFTIPNMRSSGLPYIEPLAMWRALLGDLILRTPPAVIAARFHKGLARAVVAMATRLAQRESPGGPEFDTVALSGGCFQNEILFEQTVSRLEAAGFAVLTHARVPPNDGGLALGQAAVAAAAFARRSR